MAKLRHSTRASALIAAVVPALLLTMAGSGLAASGDTTLVSVTSSGEQGNLDSYQPSISGDGRYVAFASVSDNLVEGDTNGVVDVFVRDLQAGTTERVSVDDHGNQQNDQQQRDGETFCGLDISADGRYVTFSSAADNLVPDDTNAACDVFVRDLQADMTERVSIHVSGEQANGDSWDPRLSADGRYVTFAHGPDDLAGDNTNERYDVYMRDLQAGTTERVSINSSGNPINGSSWAASISADGRYVAFLSDGINLVPDDNNDPNSHDVLVRDLQAGTTEKVSVTSSGQQANSDTFGIPSISDDGRYVAFDSYAHNLVANDTNGSGDGYRQDGSDVFLHERQAQDSTTPDTTTPPTADIVTPSDGAVYVRNQTVVADYSCEDEAGGSGLKSCEGTVAKGQPIDTGSLGTKPFTVKATDNAGNVSTVTSTYTVAECTITGTPGDDVLEGTAGYDRMCGLGGNDTLKGLGDNDELVGGAGDDSLEGGPGTDTADFTASPAGVTASLVTNQATGDGSDLMVSIENLIGSNHDDTLIGSGSKNYLSGRSGVDQLFGLEGVDRLMGGSQDDALRGGPGDDRVVANGGSDDLFGEDGADSLDSKDGVEGNDALDGGTGTDACSTDPIEESIANCEKQLNIPPTPDITPPITTSTLSSQPNAAGWNNYNVTVTLNATDDDSGVKQISFSIDGGANQTYNPTNKITVSSEGVSTISYFATDNAGNEESPAKTFSVKLDKSAPALDTVTPDDRQTGVSRTIEPTVTFSDEMDPTSLITSVKLYRWNALEKAWQRVPAKVSVVDEMATLDPYGATEQLLAANKKYKVTVTTGARNLAGIAMASPKSWTFTTKGASGEATNVPAEGTSGEAANGRIAFSHGEVVSSIHTVDLDDTGQTNLTPNTSTSFNGMPAWSPDGTRIAFSSNRDASESEFQPEEIYVMNDDGSNLRRLTDNHTSDSVPAWSPDGSRLAYNCYVGETGWEVCAMDSDGSNQTRLTTGGAEDAAWSPDGTKIAFLAPYGPSGSGIYTMNPDGSDQTLAIPNGDQVAWSPDGTKMAYRHYRPGQTHSDIYIAMSDGSNPVNLTARISDTAYELLPDWSPDGTKIAFSSNLDETEGYEIYVIDVNGRNLRRLTNAPGMDLYPDWQPLP